LSRKILIVDDEPDIHEILRAYLEKIKDVEVVSAHSGEEAVKIYEELYNKNDEPALVIIDLNLLGKDDIRSIDEHREGKDEKMDGVRTAEAILNINPNATIWGYTAWFGTEWAERLKRLGAKKLFGRTTPFKDFANMVAKFLK